MTSGGLAMFPSGSRALGPCPLKGDVEGVVFLLSEFFFYFS